MPIVVATLRLLPIVMAVLKVGAELNTTVPLIVPPVRGSFAAIEFVTVVEKSASSPRAAASSLRVFNVPGAESTRFDIAVVTYAVVAAFVLLSEADCVAICKLASAYPVALSLTVVVGTL